MYAAVPRITPTPVIIAGLVIVGDAVTLADAADAGSSALARPKSSTFTVPSDSQLDVRGLQIAMDDPLLVRGFERVGDLLRDRQRLIERNRAARNALRQVVALDEFHHERWTPLRLFEPVDGGDVRMVQRGEDFRFALKTREPIRVRRERGRQDLDRDLAIQLRVGAPDRPAPSRPRRCWAMTS